MTPLIYRKTEPSHVIDRFDEELAKSKIDNAAVLVVIVALIVLAMVMS